MSKLAEFQVAWAPRALAALRIMAALLFIEHGTQKLLGFPARPEGMGMPEGGLPPLLLVAGVLEVVGGALMAVGLFTRPVAFVLSGFMAAAYFMGHATRGFYPVNNGGDAAILYCFIFLYFFFVGGGVWSLDSARKSGT